MTLNIPLITTVPIYFISYKKIIKSFLLSILLLIGISTEIRADNNISKNKLILWLDGNDASTLFTDKECSIPAMNGDRVQCWKDKSDEKNDVLQTVKLDSPTYELNQLKNKPTLHFVDSSSGNSDRLLTTASGQITKNGSYTKFVVFKYDTTTGSNNLVSSDKQGSALWGAHYDSLSAWNLNGSIGSPGHVRAKYIGTSNYHVAATRYDHNITNKILSILNIDGEQKDTDKHIQNHEAQPLSIGSHGARDGLNGKIAEVLVYNRALTNKEISNIEIYLGDKWGIQIFPEGSIKLNTPNHHEYKIFQRDENDTYTFDLFGTYKGSCTTVEASFNNKKYITIDMSPTSKTFKGSLLASVGQGDLIVRCSNNKKMQYIAPNIGIGDVYIVAGQSNAEGYGKNEQNYTTIAPYSTIFPTFYTESDKWRMGKDKTDPNGGKGSVWPILGGYIVKYAKVPVNFITTANGSTGLVKPNDWNKNATQTCNTRTIPCFQNMLNRVKKANTNSIKAILWFQGESDANSGVSRDDYKKALTKFTKNAQEALPGTPILIAGSIGQWKDAPKNATQIRLAIQDTWDDTNNSIFFGPQAYDINILGNPDTAHYQTDAQIQTLAFRWWKALKQHFYREVQGQSPILPSTFCKGMPGRGPIVSSAKTLIGSKQINVKFKTNSPLQGGTSTAVWFVKDNNSSKKIKMVKLLNNNTIQLTLDNNITSRDVQLTYAKDNTGYDKNNTRAKQRVLTDSTIGNIAKGISVLPADVFSNFNVMVEDNKSKSK